MITGKFNVVLDQAFGSSGKGKVSTFLADHYEVRNVSSSNMPNAGHTAIIGNTKFVAKSIPTAAILNQFRPINCWLSPGSAVDVDRLVGEIEQTGHPKVYVHDRAISMQPKHAEAERHGNSSTSHIASTMQGCGVALAEKILRRPECELMKEFQGNGYVPFYVLEGEEFRNYTFELITRDPYPWLHEGSQGYALSLDHGPAWPYLTSRNCTVQAALDQMAVPPQLLGDVYLNLRTFPIRVGNITEGTSGPFYEDQTEMTWEEVGTQAGMPSDEIEKLKAREFTTVTKRQRRAANFSWSALAEAARVNGATKLCVNFVQYLNWDDRGVTEFQDLSMKSRNFVARCEEVTNVPVALIGTGADHREMIVRL